MSYFEIYQEKIRDLLATEKSFDSFLKSTQPHMSNSTMNEVGCSYGLDLSFDEDQSTRPGSLNEESYFPTSPISPSGPILQGEYDVGFTLIDEPQNNVEFRQMQQQTTKVESTSYSNKNIKSNKKKPNEKKINVVPNVKEPISRGPSGYSSLKFGDAFGTKKETFLRVREHPINGPYVENLIWKDVKDSIEMERLIEQGATNRTTYATDMNEYSSRSHALCTIKIIQVGLFY